MDITKELKMLMLKKDMKQVEVAEKFGMSKNTFNNLLKRNSFKVSDVEKIAEIIGYNVVINFIDKETKEKL